jgi:hypothetical protein
MSSDDPFPDPIDMTRRDLADFLHQFDKLQTSGIVRSAGELS